MQFVPLKNIFWYKSCETKSFCLSNQKTSEQKTLAGLNPPPTDFIYLSGKHVHFGVYCLVWKKISKSGYWYGGAAAFLFLLVVIGVIARSYFFIAFIVFAAVLFLYYSLRTPRRLLFSVTPDGISAGSKFYSYRDLKSFWIFDRKGKAELSLETKSIINSVIVIPVADVDLGELRQYLTQYAEEAEHIENFFDRVSRFIGI